MSKHTLGRSYSGGGEHASVKVKADVIEIDLDVARMAKGPADALAAAVAAGIRNIGVGAKEGAHRLFNKTGHLASGITASATGPGTYQIVPPSDRLNDAGMMERLKALLNVDEKPVRDAEDKAIDYLARFNIHASGVTDGAQSPIARYHRVHR